MKEKEKIEEDIEFKKNMRKLKKLKKSHLLDIKKVDIIILIIMQKKMKKIYQIENTIDIQKMKNQKKMYIKMKLILKKKKE